MASEESEIESLFLGPYETMANDTQAYLVTTHTPGLSAVQLQRQLEISYETAWALLHKLRRAMVNPEREALKDKVEVDETYLGGLEAGRPVDRRLSARCRR